MNTDHFLNYMPHSGPSDKTDKNRPFSDTAAILNQFDLRSIIAQDAQGA